MLKTLAATLLSLLFITQIQASDYDDAWKAIHQKNFKQAKELLLKASKDPAKALDAYITLLYINTYQGNEAKLDGFIEAMLQSPDKNPYLYPIWFNGALLGSYGKKEPYQMDLINKIIDDNSFNGSLQSASHYAKSQHYLYSHLFAKARAEWDVMGAINSWQLAGPFENLSGSGFNNNNGPIATADDKTLFKAANNVDVSWFTPGILDNEGWVFTYPHLQQRSAIVYAQSFIYSPEDKSVLLAAGCNGSLKIWVNDGLILSEAKETATELDYYKNKCNLKKGYNRVLLQLGYTGSSSPNFIIRITDENFASVKGLTATNVVQPYEKVKDASTTTSQKHFAEDFFEKKLAADPTNLLNYILLSKTYLRNERTTEARQILEKALRFSPDNPLLKFELIQCLIKSDNRTLLMQEIEWLKENDPESYINYQLKINDLINEEKYTEAEEALAKMKTPYGEDEYYAKTKISILGNQKKIDDFFKAINDAYVTYPNNIDFTKMMFRLKKQGMKDEKGALAVYEKYLKSGYSYSIITDLADEYKEQGMNDKYLAILKELYETFGYDPSFVNQLSGYYMDQQNYSKSLEYALQALKIAPYSGRNWNNVGSIQEQMKKKEEAIASLKKGIYYDRTNYDARKKLSELQGKTNLTKLLPDNDAYALIKKAPAETKYNYSYVLDEKGTIIYDEGASEEYIHYAVKIHNQKGIDSWKETSLGYNSDNQTLLVEKCEAVKANGSKVPGERNGSSVVFTGLEAGDAIHVKYRVQNYSIGRLGREYWDKFNFSAFVPSSASSYTLIVPKNFIFSSQVENDKIEPVVKEVEDYKMYKWETSNLPALRSEPYMPTLNDVGSVLHLTTLKSWADVANWYSDISYQNVSNNFELNAAYDEIFGDKKGLTSVQKARSIYEWMLTHLRYSSVSFRQSGFIPQDVARIISTRLGDCKDFSTLFVALAAKAGIPAQLVLIDTRDNGSKDMLLPSMEFNHCIVRAKIDGKDYYLELTDNSLPFGSLPNNLNGALSLLIPPHGEKSTETLKPLPVANRTADKIIRTVNVSLNGKDEKIAMQVKRFGSLTSGWRDKYATKPEDKQLEDFEQNISNSYKNPLKLEKLSFTGLKELSDSLSIKYDYTVKNEVVEAGSMKMIKIPFIDLVATMDNFSADKRDFPIEYWSYENTDYYETTVNVQLSAGQKFIEIPTSQNFSFKKNTYTIRYVQAGEKLKIIRTAKMQRETVTAAEYPAFKKFFSDIVEAESKYIVFK